MQEQLYSGLPVIDPLTRNLAFHCFALPAAE
jgi:hypothetical protein